MEDAATGGVESSSAVSQGNHLQHSQATFDLSHHFSSRSLVRHGWRCGEQCPRTDRQMPSFPFGARAGRFGIRDSTGHDTISPRAMNQAHHRSAAAAEQQCKTMWWHFQCDGNRGGRPILPNGKGLFGFPGRISYWGGGKGECSPLGKHCRARGTLQKSAGRAKPNLIRCGEDCHNAALTPFAPVDSVNSKIRHRGERVKQSRTGKTRGHSSQRSLYN